MDAIEATTNAILGLALSVLAVWLVFPLFGWAVTLKSNLAVTGLFFGLSWARSYALRRLFRWIEGRKRERAMRYLQRAGQEYDASPYRKVEAARHV